MDYGWLECWIDGGAATTWGKMDWWNAGVLEGWRRTVKAVYALSGIGPCPFSRLAAKLQRRGTYIATRRP
jgi:hypothetical protein